MMMDFPLLAQFTKRVSLLQTCTCGNLTPVSCLRLYGEYFWCAIFGRLLGSFSYWYPWRWESHSSHTSYRLRAVCGTNPNKSDWFWFLVDLCIVLDGDWVLSQQVYFTVANGYSNEFLDDRNGHRSRLFLFERLRYSCWIATLRI